MRSGICCSRGRRDVEAATAVALLTAEVVFRPGVVVVARRAGGVAVARRRAGCFELVYFALLATAYRRAPLSVVYPVARGGRAGARARRRRRRPRARHQRAPGGRRRLVVRGHPARSRPRPTPGRAASRSASRSPAASRLHADRQERHPLRGARSRTSSCRCFVPTLVVRRHRRARPRAAAVRAAFGPAARRRGHRHVRRVRLVLAAL